MRVRELVEQWEQNTRGELSPKEFLVALPLAEAAQILALAEMYPEQSVEQIINGLLSAALAELKESLPYKAGNKSVAVDEMGDPIYEDLGLTPKFIKLAKKHKHSLEQERHSHLA